MLLKKKFKCKRLIARIISVVFAGEKIIVRAGEK